MSLPVDSRARKQYPIFSGPLSYFPDAIAEVARLCKYGNDKHNPGEPLHWSREKSSDHADCIARHLMDAFGEKAISPCGATIGVSKDETSDESDPFAHAVFLAWRALAHLQLVCEEEERRRRNAQVQHSRDERH